MSSWYAFMRFQESWYSYKGFLVILDGEVHLGPYMCCKSEQSNNCFDKIFLVRIWKFTPVLVWLKALVRIHNLIQECLMFWFFWSDETHGDAEILGMQIWNFRYANMDFFKTPHIQIWFLGKDPVFKYEFLVLFSHPC